MKNYIILLLILIIVPFAGYSQVDSNAASPRKDIPDARLDKFVGTWTYSSNGDKFTIVLFKKRKLVDNVSNTYMDVLEGYHIWEPGSAASIQNIGPAQNSRYLPPSLVAGTTTMAPNRDQVSITIKNINTGKSYWAFLKPTYSGTEMWWTLKNAAGTKINNPSPTIFGLPKYVKLTKVQ